MARSSGGFYITVDFDYIPMLIARVEAQSRSAPKKVADKIAATAKQIVPVRTGNLKSSIGTKSIEAGKTAEVVVSADYAAYVEYGTYKMAARPYLAPAFAAHSKELGLMIIEPLGAI